MISITDTKGIMLAGWTTESSQSHYGQPVWEAVRIPGAGEEIILQYGEDASETAQVIWVDDETGWMLTWNPSSGGADILAVNVHNNHWGRLEYEGITFEYAQDLATHLVGEPDDGKWAESEMLTAIIGATEQGKVQAENTIHFPGIVLGAFMG